MHGHGEAKGKGWAGGEVVGGGWDPADPRGQSVTMQKQARSLRGSQIEKSVKFLRQFVSFGEVPVHNRCPEK